MLNAAAKLARATNALNLDGLLIIPYLSDENAKLLEDLKVNCIDLCGNGTIQIQDRIFITKRGYQNRFQEQRSIRNVYRGDSSIAARAFLIRPTFSSLNELHEFIMENNGHITLSTISKVVKELENNVVISKEGKQLRLLQADKLLGLLSMNYRPPKIISRWIGKAQVPSNELWRQLASADSAGFAKVCQTGRSSTMQYTAMAEGPLCSIYTNVSPEELLKYCDLPHLETNRFSNLEIIQTDENWPFFDRRIRESSIFASPAETYLELSKGDKRQQQGAQQIEAAILKGLGWGK